MLNSKFILIQSQADKDLEKEKLLELHLNLASNFNSNTDMNVSKVLAEDCMTQSTKWSNCITKFKKPHQAVRFDDGQKNEKNSVELCTNPSSRDRTCLSGHEMAWDNEIGDNVNAVENLNAANDTEAMISDMTLINPEFVKYNQSKLSQSRNSLFEEEEEEEENEPLTSEKLDHTFHNDYMRLFFPSSIIADSVNQTQMNNQTLNKIIDDQIRVFESLNESRQMLLMERTMTNIVQPNKSIMSQAIVEETETKEGNNQDKTLTVADEEIKPTSGDKNMTQAQEVIVLSETLPQETDLSILNETNAAVTFVPGTEQLANHTRLRDTTMNFTNLIENDKDMTFNETTLHETASNLNETVIQAVRDPFNFEIKLRLLERGPINQLKANRCFKSLCTIAPTNCIRVCILYIVD